MILGIIIIFLFGVFLIFMAGVLLEDNIINGAITGFLAGLVLLVLSIGMIIVKQQDYYLDNYPEIFTQAYKNHQIEELEQKLELLKGE